MSAIAKLSGIVKWRISSVSRGHLTSFVSAARSSSSISEEDRHLAEVVDRCLRLAVGSSLDEADLATLSTASPGAPVDLLFAVGELLGCLREAGSPAVAHPAIPVESGEDCPGCGLEFLVVLDPRETSSCLACGYVQDGDHARATLARADRDASRGRLRWIVDPTLHLASLALARARILERSDPDRDRVEDSLRLDTIDAQIEVALRGARSSRFREVLVVLAEVVALRASWPDLDSYVVAHLSSGVPTRPSLASPTLAEPAEPSSGDARSLLDEIEGPIGPEHLSRALDRAEDAIERLADAVPEFEGADPLAGQLGADLYCLREAAREVARAFGLPWNHARDLQQARARFDRERQRSREGRARKRADPGRPPGA
jgi:hypothetical protein